MSAKSGPPTSSPSTECREWRAKLDGMLFKDGGLGRGLGFEILTMTPEHAASLLAARRRDAPPRLRAVRAYADAMRAGRWIFNGAPIILGDHPRMRAGSPVLQGREESAPQKHDKALCQMQ